MAGVAASGRLRALSSLRHRDFRWFFLNIGVQSFGQGIQFLGIGWLITNDLVGEATLLGRAVTIFGVSNLFFTFAGGVIADRVERRLFLIMCTSGIGAITVALGLLALFEVVAIWHVFLAMFLLGALSAMQMPARFALAADLVPREDMMNALALHTAIGQIGNMVGPLVGGWFIEAMGTWSAILLNGGAILLGIPFLLAMSKPRPTQRTGASPVADLMTGFSHAVRTPMAAVLIIMSASFGFFGMAYMQVVPAFAQDHLRLNAVRTGILMTCRSGGSSVGSMVVASWGNRKNKGLLMYLELTVCCVALVVMGWAPWFAAGCIFIALVGATSIGGFWPVSSSLMQLTTEPQMRGRMMAMMQMAPVFHYLGAEPLTWLARLYGWPIAIGSGAAVLLAISLSGWFYRPMVRRMNEV